MADMAHGVTSAPSPAAAAGGAHAAAAAANGAGVPLPEEDDPWHQGADPWRSEVTVGGGKGKEQQGGTMSTAFRSSRPVERKVVIKSLKHHQKDSQQSKVSRPSSPLSCSFFASLPMDCPKHEGCGI